MTEENTQEQETKVVNMKAEASGPTVDQDVLDKAKQKFEDFANTLQAKEYLIDGGEATQDSVLKFLSNDAKFVSHEALGIVKAHADVKSGLTDGKLFLSFLAVEALSYYLSKHEGKGLSEATEFKEGLFDPINDAMARINEDKKTYENLQKEWAAAAQGIKVEELGQDQ